MIATSNDRYANLETNFLLQRLENFEGILLITSNAGDRIDRAFERRLDVVIDFPAPGAVERLAIWRLHLPQQHRLDEPVLREVAGRCSLSGGQIRNAVAHACLLALSESGLVTRRHLQRALDQEYRKTGGQCPVRLS
jgi:SpoVK/Ycf46/Vps4 family AAA+-type ATPase